MEAARLPEPGSAGGQAADRGVLVPGIPTLVATATLLPSRPPSATHGSTSHDGRYLWVDVAHGAAAAGDIEGLGNPTAERMAQRHEVPVETFLRYWTLLESVAKLDGVPADIVRRQHETPDANALAASHGHIAFVTHVLDDLVVTVAWRKSGEAQAG